MTLTASKRTRHEVKVSVKPEHDKVVRRLIIAATVISIAAYVFFYSQGTILAYKDAISHMEIARRVLDSPLRVNSNPMDLPAQLGGVWLPLPHLLMLPLVWIDPLYYSGFAGSIVSMVAFVITVYFLYKITYRLTNFKLAGIVTALTFMLNPNVLYMQSTPMTEMLLFACMASMVYGVQRWIQTDTPKYLMLAGVTGVLGTLARYEAWVLMAAMLVVVTIASLMKRHSGVKTRGITVGAFYLFGLGIPFWMGWNWLLFNNPLNFQNGQYAKPSLWVGADEQAVGNLWFSLQTYVFAVLDNLWPVIVVLMVAGIVTVLVKGRPLVDYLPSFSLLALFPFFVAALYFGQRPLHVLQLGTDLYNVRFGLLMVLPASIFIGCFVSTFRGHKLREVIVAVITLSLTLVLTVASLVTTSNIATLKEPLDFLKAGQVVTLKEPNDAPKKGYTETSDAASNYLIKHYDDGKILMESFGNELVLFKAHIPTGANIYEGSYTLWGPALKEPAESNIKWIIMRHTSQSDQVFQNLHDSPALDQYNLVYQNDTYYIYKERS